MEFSYIFVIGYTCKKNSIYLVLTTTSEILTLMMTSLDGDFSLVSQIPFIDFVEATGTRHPKKFFLKASIFKCPVAGFTPSTTIRLKWRRPRGSGHSMHIWRVTLTFQVDFSPLLVKASNGGDSKTFFSSVVGIFWKAKNPHQFLISHENFAIKKSWNSVTTIVHGCFSPFTLERWTCRSPENCRSHEKKL